MRQKDSDDRKKSIDNKRKHCRHHNHFHFDIEKAAYELNWQLKHKSHKLNYKPFINTKYKILKFKIRIILLLMMIYLISLDYYLGKV